MLAELEIYCCFVLCLKLAANLRLDIKSWHEYAFGQPKPFHIALPLEEGDNPDNIP
jgi:hypothetical protein